MATLERPRAVVEVSSISSGVPAPFPRELLEEQRDRTDNDPFIVPEVHHVEETLTETAPTTDIMPSITNLESSCILTLNNLLFGTTTLPERRHSMPSTASCHQPTTALETLVSNLRAQQGDMAELRSGPLSASDLAFELRERVVQLSNSLSTDDAALANSLATILTYFARLSSLRVAPSTSSTSHTPNDAPPPVNMYESLSRQLTDLQFERLVSQPPGLSSTTTETAILWTQIDRELENVAALCKDRSEPPQYDFADEETLYDFDSPPEYDGAGRPSLDLKRGDTKLERMTSLTSRISDEKMRLDLEGIARAIDRLYVVAPQLHNQRVELKSSKVRELEKARAAAASKGSGSSRKGKERELQSIIEMLGKASERGLSDQSVVLENGVMQSRLEKAKMKDLAKREAFVENLVQHSAAGRMHAQDATLSSTSRSRHKDPSAKLSFPEFMRETIPPDSDLLRDPSVMLTLPEFVAQMDREFEESTPASASASISSRRKGSASSRTGSRPGSSGKNSWMSRDGEDDGEDEFKNLDEHGVLQKKNSLKGKKSLLGMGSGGSSGSRNRSLSAPPLAWLRSKSSSSNVANASSSATQANGSPQAQKAGQDTAFDVVYVAENHENLHHILVFFTTTGGLTHSPSQTPTAEILPPFPEHISTGGDHLIINRGSNASLPLVLPARTTPGRKEVVEQRGHWEVKLGTVSSTHGVNGLGRGAGEEGGDINSPLLDAGKLTSVKPTSFICASCSLPLVQIPQQQQQQQGAPSAHSGSPRSSSTTPSPPPLFTSSTSSASSESSSSSASSSYLTAQPFTYRDLPSEHWEELVEAWMCHSDQKLHDQVVRHGKAGFWPAKGQAYVGGSYVLFEESVVVKQNLLGAGAEDKNDADWKVRRCLCGAIIGRSTTKTDRSGPTTTTTCFRVLKYAIRPVTPNPSDALKIPLSAFIVEDMMEYVHAHASYRFVIRDEEEEQARILIWLFKPKIRLSYTTPRSRAIPKSGSIVAAKVLYKLLGPNEAKVDLKTLLNKYPGFPQAEYLSYPMSICRRVAALLKESNTAYPEGLRTMTGLEVGWLHRR